MATYTDYARLHADGKRKIRRCYWICGEEVVLREIIVSEIKGWIDPDDMDYRSITVTAKNEPEVWDALNAYGISNVKKRRLLVVRGAERLKKLERLKDWIEDSSLRSSGTPGLTVVFLSTDDEWPQDRHPEVRERVLGSSTALYVRCSLPKDGRIERAAEIITTWGNIDVRNAEILYKRVGHDLGASRSTMQKARYFPHKVEGNLLMALSPLNPQDDVVDALLALDKPRALRGIEDLSREDQGKVIGRLTAHLDLLTRLEPIAGQRKGVRDLAYGLGVSETYVRMLLPHVRFYPRKAVLRRVMLLSAIDDAWNRGARHGVMERLVAQW
jgi:DNA polymerase III delta subunit